MCTQGGHYVSVMEGVVAKGWAFVQDDLRHVSDVMYERFQKDGYASVGTYSNQWFSCGSRVRRQLIVQHLLTLV